MEYSPSIMAIQEGVYGIKIIEKHKTDVVVELAEINTISVSVLLIAFFLVFGRWNTKKFLFGTNNGRCPHAIDVSVKNYFPYISVRIISKI